MLPATILLLRDAPHGEEAYTAGGGNLGVGEALRTRPFWLLSGAFMVCGLSVTMFASHFPLHVVDLGFELRLASIALGILGLLSAAGSFLFGLLCSRVAPPRALLGLVYLARGSALLLLASATSIVDLWIAAAIFGASWLASVPLTSGLTATTYGRASMPMLFGLMSGVHQIGDAVGVAFAGYRHDLTGSYAAPFQIVAIMLFVAGTLSFLVDGRPRRGQAPVGAEAATA